MQLLITFEYPTNDRNPTYYYDALWNNYLFTFAPSTLHLHVNRTTGLEQLLDIYRGTSDRLHTSRMFKERTKNLIEGKYEIINDVLLPVYSL